MQQNKDTKYSKAIVDSKYKRFFH